MSVPAPPLPDDLYQAARICIDTPDPATKVALSHAVAAAWRARRMVRDQRSAPPEPIPVPGRPPRPSLVPPNQLRKRGLGSEEGRTCLIHALAHIEFNAINLAWDAVYRFRDLPDAYYDGWVQVADEEAAHFCLLQERLTELGHDYGDYPAHNGLWEMACRTDHDVLVRMALVPRVLEARGLDVTPAMMERLRRVGDNRSVSILEVILRDEIGHVAVGSRWFRHACAQRGLEPETTFQHLLSQYMRGQLKGPFHEHARMEAGFSATELQALKRQAGNQSD